ncbi:hypothetical protein [Mycobacterium colombiense]|uniref:hypothetical protein n=1 Tax=Mycobacterium colombiense TaxID=339268 RepID=UPI0012DB2BC5|nr:hypothetical protein [Mycobacterium colombiense]
MSSSLVIVGLLVCGVIAAAIGQSKDRGVFGSFLLGALLGLIGIVIVAILPSGIPKPPPGMRPVRCPRCNTVQNIPEGARSFECWQCKTTSMNEGQWRSDGPEDTREWLDRVKKRP